MVVKNTEYRRAYRGGEVDELRHSWEGNLGYRQVRRQAEHKHHNLEWEHDSAADVWADDGSCSSSCCHTPSRRPASVPLHKYKHEKFNQAYRERLLRQQEERFAQLRLVDDGSVRATAGSTATPTSPDTPSLTDREDIGVQTSGRSSEEGKLRRDVNDNEKGVQVDKKTSKHPSKTTRVSKPSKPVYRKPLPKPRPMSAPIGRPLKKHRSKPEVKPSPFVLYGYRDKERETGKKKTHNIRASAGVYPAALSAMRRRKIQVDKKQEALASASYSERRKRALFNDFFMRETNGWDTEYRRSFIGYDGSEYRKSVATRIQPHAAWVALTS